MEHSGTVIIFVSNTFWSLSLLPIAMTIIVTDMLSINLEKKKVNGQTDRESLATDSGLFDFLSRKVSPTKLNITSVRISDVLRAIDHHSSRKLVDLCSV
jgi:hypothetical protein